MSQQRRRKCRHCGTLFRPDPRNLRHQRFCSKPPCRRASKAESQRQWLAKANNRDYFRGAENVERVRAWRSTHPRYWQRLSANSRGALQEHSLTQVIDNNDESPSLVIAQAASTTGDLAVVTHGLVLRSLVDRVVPSPADVDPAAVVFHNTSVTVVEGPPWSTVLIGCVTHLDADLLADGAVA